MNFSSTRIDFNADENNQDLMATTGEKPPGSIQVRSTLMESHVAGWPVSGDRPIVVAQQKNGDPLVFTVGKDGMLYVFYRDDLSPTGWSQTALSDQLSGGKQCGAFFVSQNADNKLTIVVSVEDKSAPEGQRLFIAHGILPDKVDWKTLKTIWKESTVAKGVGPVNKIRIGGKLKGSNAPMVLISTESNNDKEAAYYRIDPSTDTAPWTLLDHPVEIEAIKDIAIGHLKKGGTGIYSLYEAQGEVRVLFRGFDNPYSDTNIPLPVPKDSQVIAACANAEGYTDLFIGGEGITCISATEQVTNKQSFTVTTNEQVNGIRDLIAKRESEFVSVWAVDRQQQLMYTYGTVDKPSEWTFPLPLRNQVVQATALRNNQRDANQVFTVGADGTGPLRYRWQDPNTTIWQESEIPVHGTGELLDTTVYQTQIRVDDSEGAAQVDYTIAISASEWTYVVANGRGLTLDPGGTVDIKTDAFGLVSLSLSVKGLSTPIIYAHVSGQIIEINPAAQVLEKLRKIKTAKDLKQAVPALAESPNLDDAAKVLSKLSALADTAQASDTGPDGEAVHGRMLGASADMKTSQQVLGRALSSKNLRALNCFKEGESWSVEFNQGKMTFLQSDALPFAESPDSVSEKVLVTTLAPSHLLSSSAQVGGNTILYGASFGNVVSAAVGDVLDFLAGAAKQVQRLASKVIDGVTHLFFEVGKFVFDVVVTTLEVILKGIDWLLSSLLGITLKDIVQWLGEVFAWQDILQTHRVFKNLANQGLVAVQDLARSAEEPIHTFFQDLESKIASVQPFPKKSGERDARAGTKKSELPKSVLTIIDVLTMSPLSFFGPNLLLHGGKSHVKGSHSEAARAFSDLWEKNLAPIINEARAGIDIFIEDLTHLDKNLTPGQVVAQLGGDVLIPIVRILEKFVLELVRAFATFLALLQEGLNVAIDIPVLSALYRRIVGNDLSVIDAACLMAAMIVTPISKIIFSSMPFPGRFAKLETMHYKEIPSLLILGKQSPVMLAEESPEQALSKLKGEIVDQSVRIGTICVVLNLILRGLNLGVAMLEKTNEESGGQLDYAERIASIKPLTTTLGMLMAGLSFPMRSEPSSDKGNDPYPLQVTAWAINGTASLLPLVLAVKTEPLRGWEMRQKTGEIVELSVEYLCFVLECCAYAKETNSSVPKLIQLIMGPVTSTTLFALKHKPNPVAAKLYAFFVVLELTVSIIHLVGVKNAEASRMESADLSIPARTYSIY